MAHSITLQNISDTAIIDNDILGQICFAAPNESSGTDSILISASVFARSEGTFAADNNATELVFVTGASESAAPGASNGDMTLSSAGLLTVADDIVIKSAGTIGGANDVDLLTLGNGVLTVAGEIEGTSLDISGDGDIDGALEVGSIELGHASDTTIARASAGQITVEGTAVVLAGAVTGITSLLATDIKIGEDDQTKIDFEDANKINFYANNAKEVELAENSLSPGTSDGTALGTTSLMWSDLFLADGGVIYLGNDQDVTLTHVADTGVLLNGANVIQFRDSGLTIGSNADGDLDVVSDGTAVDSINIESAGGITLDAGTAGSGIIYEDDGTEMARIHNSSSDVILETKVSDKDFLIKGNDGGSTVTALTLDMSAAGKATLSTSC